MKTVALVIAVSLAWPALALSQVSENNVLGTPTGTAAPNASDEIAARMQRLEEETLALRAELQRLREQTPHTQGIDATTIGLESQQPMAPQAAAVGQYYTMDEIRGEIKKYAWKKGDYTITPYGCLWGNAVYATQRTSPGSYTLFVKSESTDEESEFIVDGRNTRLGVDVLGPRIPWFNCAQSGGKVEIDFQSSVVTPENKATVLLRHAYAEVKDEDFRLVIGQTWDVISPLNPGMLLYCIGWDAGNIGYRRAQLRGERFFACSDTSLITSQLSINQSILPDSIATGTTQPTNWPIAEGRVAWTVGDRAPGCLPITIGTSGHIGEVEYDDTILGRDNRRRTWSGNVDLRVPVTERLGFQGECFFGENLSAFLGGIGQGINTETGNTIRSAGGWFEVWYYWTPSFHSHVGYSVDDPVDNDIADGGKTYNQFYYGNLVYDVTKTCLVGLEVSSWKTLYKDELPGNSVRTEFVVKYGF